MNRRRPVLVKNGCNYTMAYRTKDKLKREKDGYQTTHHRRLYDASDQDIS